MSGHRRIPNRRGFVPSGWLIVGAVLACVGAAGWLGFDLMQPSESNAATPSEQTSATSETPSPTTPSATTPAPTTEEPTEEPEPTDEPEPEISRTAPVSVLNNTGIKRLAANYAVTVENAGWTISGVGNWRGQIVSNTVYFPDGLEEQGRQLARDIGIDRVMPSIVPMKTDRLTIILSGPQQ